MKSRGCEWAATRAGTGADDGNRTRVFSLGSNFRRGPAGMLIGIARGERHHPRLLIRVSQPFCFFSVRS
jgi:hypothetical protein